MRYVFPKPGEVLKDVRSDDEDTADEKEVHFEEKKKEKKGNGVLLNGTNGMSRFVFPPPHCTSHTDRTRKLPIPAVSEQDFADMKKEI